MNPAAHYTEESQDKILFEAIGDSDERAFAILFRRYAKLLFPFVFKICGSSKMAEDMIQEVMLKVWLKRDSLSEVTFPRAWIFRIAANHAYRQLEQQVQLRSLDNAAPLEDPSADLSSQLTLKQLKHHVQQAIESLPEQRQRIFRMSREQGLSRSQIAKELGVSEQTVKNTISAALQSIREALSDQGWIIPVSVILLLLR